MWQLIPTSMRIVRLNKNNISDIIEFEKEHGPDKPHYVRYIKEELEEIFDNPKACRAYGVWEDDKLIGWGAYRIKSNGAYEICSIVIDKSHRGKGLGKRMLEKLIKVIQKNQKSSNIHLTVYPDNLDALLLYLKSNFRIYDYKKNFYGPGADRLFLKLIK